MTSQLEKILEKGIQHTFYVNTLYCLSFLIKFFHPSLYLSIRYDVDGTMVCKVCHSDEMTLHQSSSHRRKSDTTVTPLYASSLKKKIKELKFRHLQELKTVLPQDFHAFYSFSKS